MRQLQLNRKSVDAKSVAPCAERLQQYATPSGSTDVLHCGPAARHNDFKVVNQLANATPHPRRCRVFPDREVVPTRSCPLLRRSRKFDFAINISVHFFALRNRRIVLNDDFRGRIQPLDPAHKIQRLVCVALWIIRVPDYKGEFWNDVKVADTPRHGQCLFRRDAFVHFLQGPVRPGFCAEEDHGASGLANQCERTVRIAADDIYAALAPPLQTQWSQPLHQLARMVFTQKKIHVIKLHAINAVLLYKMAQNRLSTRRRFHFLTVSKCRANSTEAALKRTSHAGLVCGGALAKVGRAKILLYRNAVERTPGKDIRSKHHPLRIVMVLSVRSFITESRNR